MGWIGRRAVRLGATLVVAAVCIAGWRAGVTDGRLGKSFFEYRVRLFFFLSYGGRHVAHVCFVFDWHGSHSCVPWTWQLAVP